MHTRKWMDLNTNVFKLKKTGTVKYIWYISLYEVKNRQKLTNSDRNSDRASSERRIIIWKEYEVIYYRGMKYVSFALNDGYLSINPMQIFKLYT